MAKRAFLPALGFTVVALVSLLVALVAGLNAIGCCAIDCEKFPEKCVENERRQEAASLVLLGALGLAAGAAGGAVYAIRRRG